jgi:hypothetical protein
MPSAANVGQFSVRLAWSTGSAAGLAKVGVAAGGLASDGVSARRVSALSALFRAFPFCFPRPHFR